MSIHISIKDTTPAVNLNSPFRADERMSVHLHTPTECTPTTAMDTTSMCHKLCLPTLASLSREQHGQYQRH